MFFFSTDGFSMNFSNLIKRFVNQRDLKIAGNLMNIKTVPEKASWEPRPACALLLLLKTENRNFNRSCQSNTRLVIPSLF